VAELAAAADIPFVLYDRHGWDHGVFVPVAVSWPEADMPLVAVSLRQGLDPAHHIAFGEAMAPLRDENVAIIGSGLSIHDLSFRVTPEEATAFDQWLEQTMSSPRDQRAERLARWSEAPGGRASHPREEHLLPLMVITGAGADDPVERSYTDDTFGLPVAAFAFSPRTPEAA